MKTKSLILILLISLLGCNKDSNVTLNSTLTDCPANSTCTYNYYDNADFTDFTNGSQPLSGNYRVFWYKSVNAKLCNATTSLYFKTSLNDGSFDITTSQVKAGGLVRYFIVCICCNVLYNIHPISGEIKGKRTGINQWLINATIVLGGGPNNKTIDTLMVNQNFTPSI